MAEIIEGEATTLSIAPDDASEKEGGLLIETQMSAAPSAIFVLLMVTTTKESLAMLQDDNDTPEQGDVPILAKQLWEADMKFEPITVTMLSM